MKQIVLKQLSLLHFKGIEKLTIDFTTPTTTIGGANGTGKTTVFDAFMWLLENPFYFDPLCQFLIAPLNHKKIDP